ncbi:MAG: peptidoglycan DD-metalloendopeptidase family protein [bacterium]|nr:peptidoglycan DD-metalloendopeptidase family protein [bacterium]
MNITKKTIYSVIFILILAIGAFGFLKYISLAREANQSIEEKIIAEPPDRLELVEITPNSTYGELMTKSGISAALTNSIYEVVSDKYDLAKIKAGHFLELTFDKDSDEFKQLVYKIDSEDEIIVNYENNLSANATSTEENASFFTAEVRPINYEIKIIAKEGEVETSMYEAALKNNIDERAIIELADAFQWSIDFALDPRVGDKFKFVYEERYLNGEYKMPGKILAGQYINDGKKYQVYYFEESEDNIGYFDENGNSVQKMFLKAPVAFKYISSGFTTGARYIEAFNIATGHRAVDYAATYGTPVRAVGDGTVIFASYNGSYGNMVKIRHNGTYQTNYGHMSKFAVKKGSKVKQGDVIGYIGSTGLSTGPHLHYEMVKNGAKVNPLKEVLPPGQAIKQENQERFFSEIKSWQEELGK